MGIRGANYFKVVNMKLDGMSSNHIAKRLNLSRERVRQLWMEYQTRNDSKNDCRSCSKCGDKFLPTYRYQSTCGCSVSPFSDCINCGKQTQILRNKRKFPICTDIVCIEKFNTITTQNRKLSREKRDLIRTKAVCNVCGNSHSVPLWQAQWRKSKIRCKSCSDGQRVGVCEICNKPISGTNGRCRQHQLRHTKPLRRFV